MARQTRSLAGRLRNAEDGALRVTDGRHGPDRHRRSLDEQSPTCSFCSGRDRRHSLGPNQCQRIGGTHRRRHVAEGSAKQLAVDTQSRRTRDRETEMNKFGGLRFELVTQATHGDEVLRTRGVFLDSTAQPLDVNVEGLGVADVVAAPQPVDELIARQHPPCVAE